MEVVKLSAPPNLEVRSVRGHVQTIFGKINVIMTLRGGGGGVACDANFFVCVLLYLFLQDFAAIMPIIYSTGHFIAELTLYQMLKSGKDSSLHLPDGTVLEGV